MNTLHAVPKRGDRVKNGAVIIDIKPAWDTSGYIILCLWTEDRQTAVGEPFQRTADPYVTWFARPEEGGTICYQGHYHDQLGEALLDFNNRI
jgi:hypothetical protein